MTEVTRDVELSENWTEIAQGPLLVEAKVLNSALLHFGSTPPQNNTRAFHDLNGPDSFSYGGAQKLFAKAATKDPSFVVVTEAV